MNGVNESVTLSKRCIKLLLNCKLLHTVVDHLLIYVLCIYYL